MITKFQTERRKRNTTGTSLDALTLFITTCDLHSLCPFKATTLFPCLAFTYPFIMKVGINAHYYHSSDLTEEILQ
jgi:hypothetical protein